MSLASVGKGLAWELLLAFLFYRSLLAALLLLPLAVYFVRREARSRERLRKNAGKLEFRDGILAAAAALRAGRSAENAFREAEAELRKQYGEESQIAAEFSRLLAETEISVPMELALTHMAARLDFEEALSFAKVFGVAKRSGGDLGRIMKDTAEVIAGRLEVNAEVETMLRGRRYELMLMKAIPPAMMLYLELTSSGYFAALYEGISGRLIMTGALALYLISGETGERIMQIEV